MSYVRWASGVGTYPPDLVARVRELYASPLSMRETAKQAGIAMSTLERLMSAHQIKARSRGRPGCQTGEHGPRWAGDRVGYKGAHHRVRKARGTPQHCEDCGKTGPGIYHWANLTGKYHDVSDYKRLCPLCHKRFDHSRKEAAAR